VQVTPNAENRYFEDEIMHLLTARIGIRPWYNYLTLFAQTSTHYRPATHHFGYRKQSKLKDKKRTPLPVCSAPHATRGIIHYKRETKESIMAVVCYAALIHSVLCFQAREVVKSKEDETSRCHHGEQGSTCRE